MTSHQALSAQRRHAIREILAGLKGVPAKSLAYPRSNSKLQEYETEIRQIRVGNEITDSNFIADDESCDDDDYWWDSESCDNDDDWWDPRKTYTGWDYIAHFGEDSWDKLYQARLARHHNILLRLFTRRLPNLSEHERNGLFDAFSSSREFGIEEHNSLLDALAHPKEGLNLFEYDEFGLY